MAMNSDTSRIHSSTDVDSEYRDIDENDANEKTLLKHSSVHNPSSNNPRIQHDSKNKRIDFKLKSDF